MLTHTYNLKNPIAAQQNPAVHALARINGGLLAKAKVDSFDQTLHDVDLRPGYVRLASDLSTFSTPDSFEQSGAGKLEFQDNKIRLTSDSSGVYQNQWTYQPRTGDVTYQVVTRWEMENGITPGELTTEKPLERLDSHTLERKREIHELAKSVGQAARQADNTASDTNCMSGSFQGELSGAGTRRSVSVEFDASGYRGHFKPATASVFQPYQEISFNIASQGSLGTASSSFVGVEALTGTTVKETYDPATGVLRESLIFNDNGMARRAINALPEKWAPESPL